MALSTIYLTITALPTDVARLERNGGGIFMASSFADRAEFARGLTEEFPWNEALWLFAMALSFSPEHIVL